MQIKMQIHFSKWKNKISIYDVKLLPSWTTAYSISLTFKVILKKLLSEAKHATEPDNQLKKRQLVTYYRKENYGKSFPQIEGKCN